MSKTIHIKAWLPLFSSTLVKIGNVWVLGSFSILKPQGSALNKGRFLNVCIACVLCIYLYFFHGICRWRYLFEFFVLFTSIKCIYYNQIKENNNLKILGKSEDNIMYVLSVNEILICLILECIYCLFPINRLGK